MENKYKFEKIDWVNKTLSTFLNYFYTKKINETGTIWDNTIQINKNIERCRVTHDLSYLTLDLCEISNWLSDILTTLQRSTKDTTETRNGTKLTLMFMSPFKFSELSFEKINLFLTDKSKLWFFENFKALEEVKSINFLFEKLKTGSFNKESLLQILKNLTERFDKLIKAGKCESREREEYYKSNNIQAYFELKLERIKELKLSKETPKE